MKNIEWQGTRKYWDHIPIEWAAELHPKKNINIHYNKPSIEYVDVYTEFVSTWNRMRALPYLDQKAKPPQTIGQRWEESREFMTVSDTEPVTAVDEQLFTRRQRLAQSVLGGMSGGGLSFIPAIGLDKLYLTSSYPMVGLPMVGAAAAAGIGYGIYKTRNRTESEEPIDADISAHQLTNEQVEMLQDIYQCTAHTAGDIESLSISDESMPDRFDESLAVVPGINQYAKISSVLKWIDRSAYQRARRKPLMSTGDFRRASELLTHGADELYFSEINEAFKKPAAGGSHTPLSLLALVRMKKRGEFVTKYRSEFQKMTEKMDAVKHKYLQIQDTVNTQIAINNDSEYFRLQADSLWREVEAIMAEVALMDLRLTALAFVYDEDSAGAEKRYVPLVTERVQEERLDQWRQSIDELCQMPFDDLSDDMAEVLIVALQSCRERINEPGDYGAATGRVVEYIKSIAGYVNDQGAATEAIRKINTLLA